MSLFGNLFGHYKDPSKAAMRYVDQIPGQAHAAFDPYINRGNAAGDQLSDVYGNMLKDPNAFYNDMMKNYTESPDFQLKLSEGLGAAGNTAAAGGYRGSQADLKNSTALATRLRGDDMQQWFRNVMGIQDRGTAGQQNMYNTGFNASSNLAGDVNNALGQNAQYAAQGVQGRNAYNQQMMDAFFKLFSQGLGAAGGGMAGGLPGAVAGAQGNYVNFPV